MPEPGRCSTCTKYRQTLLAMLHRVNQPPSGAKCSPTNPSSTTNLRYLTTPQKVERFRRLRLDFKQSQSKLERLRTKLAECVERRSTDVDSGLHQDLLTIVEENSSQVRTDSTCMYNEVCSYMYALINYRLVQGTSLELSSGCSGSSKKRPPRSRQRVRCGGIPS